ncbi:unnamed protein product [Phytophthora fragariaefolia]|uniref:Unnamed protein product n=1 Tax=Phytophthora fragariaefolia TaxID=1490495 RepID=A0A9W6Y0T1_9STRA|nr:unnamed protein product [Phytophthora fragariaefolia]
MDSESSSSADEALVVVALLAGEEKGAPPCRFNFTRPSTDSVWRDKFRFEKDEILQRVEYFSLEDPFPTTQWYSISALKALSIFLRRMAYPARLSDLEDLFGRDTTVISSISNAVLDTLYDKFHGLLQFDYKRLTTATLSAYASAIHAKEAPLETCVGFIDGTVRWTCRPNKNQRYMFNGHKVYLHSFQKANYQLTYATIVTLQRKHALKYQSVITPDGIIIHLSGPFAGTRHDAFILYESKLLDVAASCLSANG